LWLFVAKPDFIGRRPRNKMVLEDTKAKMICLKRVAAGWLKKAGAKRIKTNGKILEVNQDGGPRFMRMPAVVPSLDTMRRNSSCRNMCLGGMSIEIKTVPPKNKSRTSRRGTGLSYLASVRTRISPHIQALVSYNTHRSRAQKKSRSHYP
jgi:hypothetical protein